jgi:DASH complex subunit DAD3
MYIYFTHHSRVQATIMTRKLSETPDKTLLARLRVLEKKMGLVLTLVRVTNEIVSELARQILPFHTV